MPNIIVHHDPYLPAFRRAHTKHAPPSIDMSGSRRKNNDLIANAILLAATLIAWFYAIYAGAVVSKRYLDRLDLSDYYLDQRVPKFWRTTSDEGEID